MLRIIPLMALVACAPKGPSADTPPSGECSSTTRKDWGSSYEDTVTWLDAQGRELQQQRDVTSDGTWIGTEVIEYGYIGDLLVSVRLVTDGVDDDGAPFSFERLTVHAYDELGRLAEDRLWVDDQLERLSTYRYDGLGQHIGTERRDAAGALVSIEERWWSEGRLDRWENRGPEGGVFSYADYDYLLPAPALDADVTDTVTFGRYTERYDGERLVEREVAPDVSLWGGTVWQWVHRDDGQVELERSYNPDRPITLAWSDYDDAGRLVRRLWGLDHDGDDVIDVVDTEQTWAWTCD